MPSTTFNGSSKHHSIYFGAVMALLPIGLTFSDSVAAENRFHINVPLSLSVEDIRKKANQVLPSVIHQAGPSKHTCVQPTQSCMDVPEVHGLEIKMRRKCLDLSPAISCNVTEIIQRSGALQITPQSHGLTITQLLKGSVRAQGRGDLGKSIQQTVRAKAQVIATINPSINPDWTISPGLQMTHSWTEAPEFQLFGLIPVTLRGKVDPIVKDTFRELNSTIIPEALRSLKLSEKMESIWRAVQRPVAIPITDTQKLNLHLRPESVGLSAIEFTSDTITVRPSITGEARISDQTTKHNPVSLPQISAQRAEKPYITAKLPIDLSYDTLTSLVQSTLPSTVNFIGDNNGTVTINQVNFQYDERGLLATLDVDINARGLLASRFNAIHQLQIKADASLSRRPDILKLENPSIKATSGTLTATLFNHASQLGLLDRLVGDKLNVPLTEWITKVNDRIQLAIHQANTHPLRISGEISISPTALSTDRNQLTLMTELHGELAVTLDKL